MSPIPSRSDRTRGRTFLAAVLIALLFTASTAEARRRADPRPEPLETALATRYDAEGRPVVTVTIAQPHRALVFTRDAEGGFDCELRVTVIVRRDGHQVAGGVHSERVRVADAGATRAETRLSCTVPVTLDADRPVKLDIRAEVVGTSRWWRRELEYAPGGGGAIPWYFTTFAWNLDDGAAGLSLEQRVDSLRVEVGLGRRPGDGDVAAARFLASVRDAQGAERILAERDLSADQHADSLLIRFSAATAVFPFGLQTLTIRLQDGHGARLDLSPDHELVNLGVPFGDDEAWRRHVGWLEDVVPDKGDRRVLAELPVSRRAEAWRDLWEARGPDRQPDESEHLGRIVEADRRFGRFGRGALSDRGRILIRGVGGLVLSRDRGEDRVL